MVRKNKFNLLKLFFILSAALAVFLSTASNGQAKPFPEEQINLTVPSSINVQQTSQGELMVSDFVVENKTPVGFNIESIQVAPVNDWKLATNRNNLNFNSKKIFLEIEKHPLKIGENSVTIPIDRNSSTQLKIDIGMHCFDHTTSEKAFELAMEYELVPRKFSVTLYNPKGGSFRPISGMCGEIIQLPKLDLPNFIGWTDFYSKEFYGTSMAIPIGGTRVVATYKQTVLDVSKWTKLPFMGADNTQAKTVTGVTLKYGHPSDLNFEYWDISKQGNKSIICYRESQDPNSEQYNNIIVAANEKEMDIEGDVSKLFLNTNTDANGSKSSLKYFRTDGVLNYRMSFGNINGLFEGCEELVDISGLSTLITKNFTAMKATFKDCIRLVDTSPLERLSEAELQDTQDAFSGCTMSDMRFLENWNVSKMVEARGMFSNCPNIRQIDLSKWNISNSCNMDGMFLNTPLERGYAKTQDIADRLNSIGGLSNKCFQIKS